MEKKFKIGFIVEGTWDRIVVEAIARRVLPAETIIHTVRLGGKIAWSTPHSSVVIFRAHDYSHVVLVGDADCPPGEETGRQQQELEGMMRAHQFSADDVSVCLAVPTMEAWLLAPQDPHAEANSDPRKALADRENVPQLDEIIIARLAAELDIQLARSRSPSLNQFISILEQQAARHSHGGIGHPQASAA